MFFCSERISESRTGPNCTGSDARDCGHEKGPIGPLHDAAVGKGGCLFGRRLHSGILRARERAQMSAPPEANTEYSRGSEASEPVSAPSGEHRARGGSAILGVALTAALGALLILSSHSSPPSIACTSRLKPGIPVKNPGQSLPK